MEKYINNELTEMIIKAFYNVYNELGFGFLENVYQNALFFELKNNRLKYEERFSQMTEKKSVKILLNLCHPCAIITQIINHKH